MPKKSIKIITLLSVIIILIITGALYVYLKSNQTKQANLNQQKQLVGNDKDAHGCLPSAGYTWCPSTNKCQRMWEEYCAEFKDQYRGVVQDDLIRLISPRPEEVITSPLKITGEARGTWFFEGVFPVILTDWDGLIIAQGQAKALTDWTTEDYVPFEANLEFKSDTKVSNRGSLILKKDNPSGLPQNDKALEITVFFAK
jgi:hypothetical protein